MCDHNDHLSTVITAYLWHWNAVMWLCYATTNYPHFFPIATVRNARRLPINCCQYVYSRVVVESKKTEPGQMRNQRGWIQQWFCSFSPLNNLLAEQLVTGIVDRMLSKTRMFGYIEVVCLSASKGFEGKLLYLCSCECHVHFTCQHPSSLFKLVDDGRSSLYSSVIAVTFLINSSAGRVTVAEGMMLNPVKAVCWWEANRDFLSVSRPQYSGTAHQHMPSTLHETLGSSALAMVPIDADFILSSVSLVFLHPSPEPFEQVLASIVATNNLSRNRWNCQC